MTHPFKRTFPAVAAALLAGCSLIPAYERPAAPVAAQWSGPLVATQARVPASELPWADFGGDASLRELIRLALVNNRDLRVAVLAIEQARATWQVRRADQFPTVNLGATGAVQPKPNGQSGTNTTYTAGLSATSLAGAGWEIDFFGRLDSLKEAARAQYLATEDARWAVQASLIASVATVWLSLQTNDQLLTLTQRTLATRDDSLRLTRLRLENGAASALDFRQAESLSAGARAAMQQQQRLRALDVNTLTLLVGQPLPDTLLKTADTATGSPFREVPAGLPSDLLERRPDIRQAEEQLIAANANIGAAKAAFFPRITLTASYGTASSGLNNLFQSGFWGGTLGSQILQPIFDAGRNEANLASTKAARAIAVAQYEKSIQTAFREVADALAGRATLREQLAAQQAQVDAEAERFRLADLRYRNGISSYLEVLDSQRSLFAFQQALAQVRLAYLQNQVALYKALGGGAEAGTPAAAAGASAVAARH